ncbi:hypothetical protein A9762_04675 [Pandoraea sp. ISTKB]|nr:hypothetical protein A9762_04675 [Pandoraea sp. ISTKB]
MRRRWFPLWLVVCVLVSQMALARHVVFHTAAALAAASAQSAQSERQHGLTDASDQHASDEDGICEQCLAFIAVDVALPALPVFAAPPSSRDWHYPPAAPLHVRSVSRGPTRNRDPPRTSMSLA